MTQEPYLPFSKPSISQATLDEVLDCLKSGWLATGPRVQRLEEQLQAYFKAPHVLAVTSGTAGLHLALKALNLQPGDEVITTAMTFVASLNTIVLAGAKPVLVDIDDTYNMDIDAVKHAVTPRTRAIMPVHFTGLPVDLDPLYDLAHQHQLHIVEDAAQAIGTHYKGRLIGSFGSTQVFSFHPNKNMTTGEGGCVVTTDPALARAISVLRFHGIDRNAFNRFSKSGSQHYDVIEPGFKYNMMDLQAAIGLHQLAELPSFIEKRTRLAQRYQDILSSWSQLKTPSLPKFDHRHNWHLYAVLIQDTAKINRDEFISEMKKFDIGVGLHYTAPHLFTYYRKTFGFKPGDFPKAEQVGDHIVSLPLFPDLSIKDQDRVITAMERIFARSAV